MSRIYVASSWRNSHQPIVVRTLREAGHEVYDFRNPREGVDGGGFQWASIDPKWQTWTPLGFREALKHPLAVVGFGSDMDALEWCDICVLVMPCGRSAHLEAGWAKGAGKPTFAIISDGDPELMYRMFDRLCFNTEEVLEAIQQDLDGA